MRKGQLRNLIFFSLMAVALLPLLLSFFFTHRAEEELLKEEELNLLKNFNAVISKGVDSFFQNNSVLLDNFLTIHTFHDRTDISLTHKDISDFIRESSEFISLAFFDSSAKEYAYFGPNPKFKFNQEIKNTIQTGVLSIGNLGVVKGKGLSAVIAIKNTFLNKTHFVAAQIPLSNLKNYLPSGRGNILIFTKNGFLIYSSDEGINEGSSNSYKKEMSLLSPRAEEGVLVSIENEGNVGVLSVNSLSGWLIYTYDSADKIEGGLLSLYKRFYKEILIILAIVLLFALFMSIYVSSIMVTPLNIMTKAFKKVEQGKDDQIPDLPFPNNEIGALSLAFAKMLDSLKIRFDELRQEREDLEGLNQSLQIRVGSRTKELRTALNELIKKERLAAIGQMASIVSHEIKNPLAVIKNAVYLIKARLGSGADVKIAKNFKVIDEEINQANSIIEEILGYARTREQILTTIDLSLYAREILSSYPIPQNIQLTTYFYSEDLLVTIDTEEMKQALRNIVANAIEVMPKGGMLVVKTKKIKEGYASLSITDSGPGIPEELQEQIFTPFFTTKARGTGLGLAVVKKVCARNKVEFKLKSEVGKGTKMTFVFKLAGK
ncbi:MAG: hypothetical protein J5594_05385 [Elusimicrobiaceae bacterium]|nr:hypothetical protein [Elusimicrobiaceae bacterium]